LAKPNAILPISETFSEILKTAGTSLTTLSLWFVVPAGSVLLIWLFLRTRRKSKKVSPNGWQESVQKSVRVSIGETRCLQENGPTETGLLIADDLKAYSQFECAFYRLEFSLTMLPDRRSSMDFGELSLELISDSQVPKLPFFVRLHPDQEIVLERRKLKKSGDGKATFNIPAVGEVGGEGKLESESELQVETVAITSWGAGEQNGGWRFNATTTRSIKTSITGLTALVAVPPGRKSRGRFRAAAHLRSFGSSLGRMGPAPEAFIEYEFPPTLEIPPAAEKRERMATEDGIRGDNLPAWAKEEKSSTSHRTIRIFLASSSELREDRDEFELYFRQQNDRFRKEGFYLELVRWENFLDAMSETRLQDEYNKAIRDCDIFVSLFFRKTGKFTEEEFDTAHQQFKITGRPQIYTFFKNAEVLMGAIGPEVLSLLQFKKKLDDLGHFYTGYDNIEHLKRQFRDQLDKLLGQEGDVSDRAHLR
jgi:hypothetical protein